LITCFSNFAPRFGFAWDVFGDHKTALHVPKAPGVGAYLATMDSVNVSIRDSGILSEIGKIKIIASLAEFLGDNHVNYLNIKYYHRFHNLPIQDS